DEPGREPVAANRVLHRHRKRRGRRLRRTGAGRALRRLREPGVAELHAKGVRQLAGEPAHGHLVAAVRRDLDVDDDVVEADVRASILPRLRAAVRVEYQDARVAVAHPELAAGADHAVGDVPVRLAGRDLEPAGQHSTGQDDGDQVANLKVGGATHDLLRLTRAVGVTDVHGAEPDRLLEPGELLDGEHPT